MPLEAIHSKSNGIQSYINLSTCLPINDCRLSLSLSLSLSPFVFLNQTNSLRLSIRLSLYVSEC